MAMNKRSREVLELAKKAGATSVEGPVMTGKTHLCVRVQAPNGSARKFFTALTPSDRRAALNFMADVRTFCHQNAGSAA